MANVGALRVTLGANTAQYEAGMKRAQVTARTTAASIQRSLAGIKGAFGAATAGLVGGALIGGLVQLGKQSLEAAASLGEVAQQLGVTTEALQVYRFIGSQVGLTTEEVDASLGKLSDSIAEAGKGTKAQAEAFNELRVNVKTADGQLKDTDRVIREMADGFSTLKSEQDQVRISRDLMGKGGTKFVTVMSDGASAIDELAKAAHNLNIVLSEEQIQNADRTADKLEELKLVLSARIAGVVSDNAGAIYDLANSLASLAEKAVQAAGAWLQFAKTIGGGNVARGAFIGLGPPGLNVSQIPIAIADSIRNRRGGAVGVGEGFGTSVSGTLGTPRPFVAPSATGLNRIAGGGGGRKGPRGKTAEQLAEEAARARDEALRRAADADNRLADAKADELRAQQDLIEDYVDRQEISHQLIDIETDQQNKDLALAVALGDLDKNVALELKRSNERLRILKKQEVNLQVELDRQRDFELTEEAQFEIQRERLKVEASLAETAAERRRVELEILNLAYRERKQALERFIAQTRDEEARKRAEAELRSLPAQQALDTRSVLQGTRGPLESFQAGLPTTADKMNEALQLVATDGLQALEQGILDVIDGTKSLGEAFRDMASQIIAELLRIQIQRAIIGPLANILGSAIGGGGTIASLASASQSLIAANPGIFANGGYTGNVGTRKVAGFVHGQEYVFDAEATRRIGVGNLEAIRRGMPTANDNARMRGGDVFNMPINIPAGMTPKQARETGAQFAAGFQSRIAMAKRQGF